MRRHILVSASSMRRLALLSMAVLLLPVLMSACGSTSNAQVTPTATPLPPTRSQYCMDHSYPDTTYTNQQYEVRFWQQGIMVLGIAPADNPTSITTTDEDLRSAVQTFLKICFPSSQINVSLLGKDLFKNDHGLTETAFFQLSDTNNEPVSDAELKTVIDAINSSDTLPISSKQVPQVPFIGTQINGTDSVIIGASPDWNMNGQPSTGGGYGGGSPDGPPSPDSNATANINDASAGSGKTIYVLDTVPPMTSGGATSHTNKPGPVSVYCGSNPVCAAFFPAGGGAVEVKDQQMQDEDAYICTTATCPQHLSGSPPTPASTNPPGADTSISKHGIFVSEIIHNLAPSATVHLVRVLNDYGVGDLKTLIDELSAIETIKQNQANVIINMSLTIEPPPVCLLPIWQHGYEQYRTANSDTKLDLSKCAMEKQNVLNVSSGENLYQKRLILPFGQVISEMIAKGFTVVAAAGNDSAGGTHYDADMPAAFCGVHSVAAGTSATNGNWQSSPSPLADFSNNPYVAGNQCLSVPADKSAMSLASIQLTTAASGNVVAPGVNICSLYVHVDDSKDPFDRPSYAWLATWSGSSFASAFVTGNLAAGTTLGWSASQPCTP